MKFVALIVLVSVLKEGLKIDVGGKRWPDSAVGKTGTIPLKNCSWNDYVRRPSQSNSASYGNGERYKTSCKCSSTVNCRRSLTTTSGNHQKALNWVNANSSSGRISRGVADCPNPGVCRGQNSILSYANVPIPMRDYPPPPPPPGHWGPSDSLPMNYIQDRFRYTITPNILNISRLSTEKSKLSTYNYCFPSSTTVTTTPVCTTSTRCPTTTGDCVVTTSTRRRSTACLTTKCATTTTPCATTTTSCASTTTPCATTSACLTSTSSGTTTSVCFTTSPCTTTSCGTLTTSCGTSTTSCGTSTTSCGTSTTSCGTLTTSCGTTKTPWKTSSAWLTTTTPCPTSTSPCLTTTRCETTVPSCMTSTETVCKTSTTCEPIIHSEYVDLFPQAPYFRPQPLPPFKFRPLRNPAPRSANNAEEFQQGSQGRDKIDVNNPWMSYLLRLNNLTEKIAMAEKCGMFKSSPTPTAFEIILIVILIIAIIFLFIYIINEVCKCRTSCHRRQ